MNQDLQSLFNQAFQLAERGEYCEAARAYERFLEMVRSPRSGMSAAAVPQALRSAAFNLAQVYNKLKEFQRALELAELGLSCAPNERGQAIALAAKGEALCSLGRIQEGQAAFEEATRAHATVGRLNAADSMTRLESKDWLTLAEEWVTFVEESHGGILHPELRAEVSTIRGKIAVRRGNIEQAREYFNDALRQLPGYEDATLQLRRLDRPAGGEEKPKIGLFSRLFRHK